MASAWGTSWGTSWGNSWGDTGGVTPPVIVSTELPGSGGKKRRRKKGTVIRFSDFQSMDEYEKAVAAAMAEANIIPATEVIHAEPDDDDDDEILRVLTLTILH